MKALPKRKGNIGGWHNRAHPCPASMKALPKRKGNAQENGGHGFAIVGLNESPSKKEGKYSLIGLGADLASLPQ